MNTKKIRIALPTGSLKGRTLEILRNGGIDLSQKGRSYVLEGKNECSYEYMLVKPQEMPKFVERGFFDAGVSGMDWIRETAAEIRIFDSFPYSKRGWGSVRLVVAVSEGSLITSVDDLEGKVIATEFVNLTKEYLKKNGINASVEFSWGATESKPSFFCDAVVDIVDSGESLAENRLRMIDTLLESPVCLFTKKDADNGTIDSISPFFNAFLRGYKKSVL